MDINCQISLEHLLLYVTNDELAAYLAQKQSKEVTVISGNIKVDIIQYKKGCIVKWESQDQLYSCKLTTLMAMRYWVYTCLHLERNRYSKDSFPSPAEGLHTQGIWSERGQKNKENKQVQRETYCFWRPNNCFDHWLLLGSPKSKTT